MPLPPPPPPDSPEDENSEGSPFLLSTNVHVEVEDRAERPDDFLNCSFEERYERVLVMNLLRDQVLFGQYLNATKPFTQGQFREFQNPLNAVAAQVVSAIYAEQFPVTTFDFSVPLKIPRPSALLPYIRRAMDHQGAGFMKSLDECVEHTWNIFEYPVEEVRKYEDVVKWSVEDWLLRRLHEKVDRDRLGKIWMPGEAQSALLLKRQIETKLRNSFPKAGDTDPLSPKDLVKALTAVEDLERLATGFTGLDAACLGGFVRSKTWWIAGVRGSGKSTFVGQIALHWMFSGFNGVFISTEMDEVEMAIKWACCALELKVDVARHVIHHTLKDRDRGIWREPGGYNLTERLEGNIVKALTERQLSQLDILFDLFRSKCYFIDFRGQPGIKLPSLLRELYSERMFKHFEKLEQPKPKWVVFDWPAQLLRGVGDAEAVRNAYKSLISDVVNLSASNQANVASIIVGQLNMSEAWGKKFLTEANSPDSKQLGPELQGIGCISALPKADDDHSGNILSKTQWLNISKNRYGQTVPVHLECEFEYSRFRADWL
jgi:hypothetical protein